MPRYTDEERQLLDTYVTNTESDVFAIKNLPGMTGAIYARYSRAPGGFRDTLLKEFIKEGKLDPVKAQELIERVLIAFGDDSVGELEPAHVSFENISILATKEIEDRRIGGSPIEQSTRYVFYDQKDDAGNWRYYRDPDIMASSHATAYVEAMDFAFDTYVSLIEPMQDFYRAQKSINAAEYDINGDGVKEHLADLSDPNDIKAFKRTYTADIRTKACDTLRALLPIATKTHVGIMGNGRFFQWVISHCLAQPYTEVRDIATSALAELCKVIPTYVKRAKASTYTQQTNTALADLAKTVFANIAPASADTVTLTDRGEAEIAHALGENTLSAETLSAALSKEADILTEAIALYPHLTHPLDQIRAVLRCLPEETHDRIKATLVGTRGSRRDRPGRSLETGYPYTFDMLTDFGTYKDLMRHRMSTQVRQAFTPALGFSMPEDLVTAGFADNARAVHERMAVLYAALVPEFPHAASYATLHGSLVRWVMGLNDRSAMHLIELRTTPQGHPSYRRVAQLMHNAITARSPWRGGMMKFADHGTYGWARGDAEARQRVKEKELEAKGV